MWKLSLTLDFRQTAQLSKSILSAFHFSRSPSYRAKISIYMYADTYTHTMKMYLLEPYAYIRMISLYANSFNWTSSSNVSLPSSNNSAHISHIFCVKCMLTCATGHDVGVKWTNSIDKFPTKILLFFIQSSEFRNKIEISKNWIVSSIECQVSLLSLFLKHQTTSDVPRLNMNEYRLLSTR